MTRDGDAEFIILTGPLGSGKTTLLMDYLSSPQASETGVIVNEAGAIDIDGAILSTASNGTSLTKLPNGCICCSLGNDLLAAVDTLIAEQSHAGRAPFRQIVLECSGLAYPAPIVRNVAMFRKHAFRLRVLSTFDGTAGPPDEVMLPIVASQLAAAQAVVLTKVELVGVAALDQAIAAITSYNPLVKPIVLSDRSARAASAFAPSSKRTTRSILLADHPTAHPRIKVFRIAWPVPPPWRAISDWLDVLSETLGMRLLRVKGLVTVRDCPDVILVESVGTTFATPRRIAAEMVSDKGLVVIARDIECISLSSISSECRRTVGPNITDTSSLMQRV